MADVKQAAAPTFTREELVIINNALNEICNGVKMSDGEFQTRVGYSREDARKLLAKVGKAIEK